MDATQRRTLRKPSALSIRPTNNRFPICGPIESRGGGEGTRNTVTRIVKFTAVRGIRSERTGGSYVVHVSHARLISHGTGRWRRKRRESKVSVEQLEKWNWFRFDDRTNLIGKVGRIDRIWKSLWSRLCILYMCILS